MTRYISRTINIERAYAAGSIEELVDEALEQAFEEGAASRDDQVADLESDLETAQDRIEELEAELREVQ
jgi:predicted  nucleic acid-binding Zn-ribbon protein